jgi:hypothetical protein
VALVSRGNDLLPAGHPLRERARPLLQECQRYMALDARLPAILRGAEKPADAAEQLGFAQLCFLKHLYAAAARFYDGAFTAEPKLAEDASSGARYNAACVAALTGCARGKDADRLDGRQRGRWRRQALDWLRRDLTWWGERLASGNAQAGALVRQRLRQWQVDPDLAGVRAGDSLAGLPDGERRQWQRLWSDVDSLLRRVQAPE